MLEADTYADPSPLRKRHRRLSLEERAIARVSKTTSPALAAGPFILRGSRREHLRMTD
jgi:hypothetical protein